MITSEYEMVFLNGNSHPFFEGKYELSGFKRWKNTWTIPKLEKKMRMVSKKEIKEIIDKMQNLVNGLSDRADDS